VRLTRASLECLSIVAYRQPVTRADVEDVRGVDSGGVLRLLLDRNLIRILGKKEEPGRPLLYGTTKEFLAFFNLRDLRDLPTLRDFSELSEEHRLKVETLHGAVPEAPPEGPPPPLAPGERPHLTLVPAEPAADEGAAPAPVEGPTPPAGAAKAGDASTADLAAAAEAPVDATAVDLAQAARAAEIRAAAAGAAAGAAARDVPPEHEDEAARAARLARERDHAEVDDKLVGELEAALQQAERIRREIDPPKPRAPRVPAAPLPDGTLPPADGAAPPGGVIAGDPETAGEAGLLGGDEPPPDDEDPPPDC
jgi:segregation and condensation protein B